MKTKPPRNCPAPVTHPCHSRVKHAAIGTLIVLGLTLLPPRRSSADDFIDSKVLYYQEAGNRMKIMAPTFLLQRETENGWTIKIDGIYNSISGASPTGAPPRRKSITTVTRVSQGRASGGGGDDEDDGDGEGDSFISGSANAKAPAASFASMTGATPAPTPAPTSSSRPASTTTTGGGDELPTAEITDHRLGLNLGLSKRVGNQTPSLSLSFSTEQDYRSTGLALQDALDFNKKNTTVTAGGAYTFDRITPSNDRDGGTKRTTDGILGLTQVLTPTTLLTLNLGAGRSEGYMSDPYKVVELNGVLVPEKRPDSKTKTTLYIGLAQFIAPADASIELGLRHYSDSFGISSATLSVAWFQKVTPRVTLCPSFRYYDQTAADFYAVRFSGTPEFYSADYRVSALRSLGYGLKLLWTPTPRFSMDVGYERYDMQGSDGETSKDVYPSANLFIAGARLCL